MYPFLTKAVQVLVCSQCLRLKQLTADRDGGRVIVTTDQLKPLMTTVFKNQY